MPLIKCNECEKDISDKADICPNCGAPVIKKRNIGFALILGILILPVIFVWFLLRKGYAKSTRIWGFVYLAFSLFFSPFIFSGGNTSTESATYSSEQSNSAPAQRDNRPVAADMHRFKAQELADAYDQNTVAADNKFKGKWILISGRVAEINTDFTGSAYVAFSVENQFNAPQAKFVEEEKNKLANLQRGQFISAICMGNGDIVKTPMLGKCTFVD